MEEWQEVLYLPHTIPIVPDEFRKLNGNAYIPKVVSIGPRHSGRSELLPAEGFKLRSINSLFDSGGSFWFIEDSKEAVVKLDGHVRKIYANKINLDTKELAGVMVYDGLFLLALINAASNLREELKNSEYVLMDILLMENQIPLVILITLFKGLSPGARRFKVGNKYCSEVVQKQALSFFGISHTITSSTNSNFCKAYHILDIVYLHLKTQWPEEEDEERQHVIDIDNSKLRPNAQHLNRCATRLQAVGITIKCLNNNQKNTTAANADASSSKESIPAFSSGIFEFFKHNVKFNKSNGILEIPHLEITPTTEFFVLWKNFIAWENNIQNLMRSDHIMSQLPERCLDTKTGRGNFFTSSALFFSDLICCTSDVQLLKNKGIIVDHSGKCNRDLMDLFHSNICGVDRRLIDPMYATMFHQFNTYSSPINYATKHIILLPHYFFRFLEWIYNLESFFRRGYNFAATVVTLLTVVQTCYAIVAYHHPK